jgi:NADH-quinone oxidoreductase subunit M
VGEFLVLVGAFEYNPWVAAVAALCMILAAGYLLWMYQRAVFGHLSDFLKSLGDHLTDMRPVEVLSLVPLATLTVIFGLLPGLLLVLVSGTVQSVLADVANGAAVNLVFWQ